ncbi:helix-turn-helix domain-containing protein [Aquimarina litoralis]|uniref:helix-turn-helix domain-containing protein n=1 Tax=Aquimarina litoralis TaxID=584605 RepID=UPI001C57C560|nr:helix-turn-helix domain-containing protein [Aquimarina litoralis]MBW1298253.1 helix-turn-helix domain-containing protein [Aquimarina litoralis]
MKTFSINILLIILLFPFTKGLAFQQNTISIEEKDFILNHKQIDSVEAFLKTKASTSPILAKKAYQIYLERGITNDNNDIVFNSYYYLGDNAYNRGDYINAINYSKFASEIAEITNNETLKLSSYTLNGNSFFAIRYYNNASIQYQKARNAAKKIGNTEDEIASQININNCWVRIDRYKEALQSFEEINKKLTQKEYQGDLYYSNFLSTQIGAGVCSYKLQKYDEAISFYHGGLKLAKRLQLNETISTFHNTLGEVYTAKKEYKIGIQHLDTAKALINENDKVFNQTLYTTNFHLANIYFKKEQFENSLSILEENFKVIDSEEKERQIEKIDEMYDLARQCSEKLHDSKKELYYTKAYNKIKDFRHQDDINTRDQLYNADLIELEEEKDLLLSKNNLYIICLVSIIIILFLVLIYHFQKQKKNKALFDQLQKSTQIITSKKEQVSTKKEFVTDQKANDLFMKLKELEKTSFFLKEDCSLHSTAKLINTNTTYLSKMMNTHRGSSFNEYINELRIKYCREQLNSNSKFRSYTIKAIAGELGYKSVNTFGAAFKKHTGLTHSYYIKQVLSNPATN